jgi:hypothetical protein
VRAGLLAALLLAACGQAPDIGGPGDDAPGDDEPGDPDAGPDAVPADAVVTTVPPEVDGRLVINEMMTTNAITLLDADDQPNDWIELYNPNDEALSLHGYTLTDDLTIPNKHVFAEGLTIPGRGYLILWLDDMAAAGPAHVGFKLDRKMGEVGLARPDTTWIDRITYGEQAVDFSASREPDGSDHWVIEWHPSPGSANPAGPGQPVGLEETAAPPEAVPACGDLSEEILGYDAMPEFELQISPAGITALQTQPFTYVQGNIVFRGRTYGPVGIRLKGGNSFQPINTKPSFRINVDEYVEGAKFYSLDDLTFNNMDDDYSMLHERIAYWVMRAAGVPSSRANHAFLHLNGEVYGLYSNVETVKKSMVSRWFPPEATGSLFEATDVDFVAADIPDYDLEFGPDDRSLLQGVASAMNIPGATAAMNAAGQYADMNAFRRYWAVAAVIGQFDAFPYSMPGDDYFAYADAVSDRLKFMPWGMDETFYSASFDVTNVHSVLAVRCKEDPGCYQAWIDQVWEVLDLTEAIGIEAERVRVADQIDTWVIADTNKLYPTEQVWTYQGSMYWFLDGRRADLETMLGPSPP